MILVLVYQNRRKTFVSTNFHSIYFKKQLFSKDVQFLTTITEVVFQGIKISFENVHLDANFN